MAYLEAVERFGKMKDEVEGLLSERDEAYLELLAVPDTAGALLCKRPPAMLWTMFTMSEKQKILYDCPNGG